MMDEAKGQEARRQQEPRRTHEAAQDATKMVEELRDKSTKTMSVWADANQRVLTEVFGLSVGTAQESARVMLHFQQRAAEMIRDTQAAAFRCQMNWPETLTNPVHWYQSIVQESVEAARKAFDALNSTSQVMTHSVDRLQASTEQAGKNIEATLTAAASRMKDMTRAA